MTKLRMLNKNTNEWEDYPVLKEYRIMGNDKKAMYLIDFRGTKGIISTKEIELANELEGEVIKVIEEEEVK